MDRHRESDELVRQAPEGVFKNDCAAERFGAR
jgi:hypothetical protein